ncbi:hypothetical protein EJB05_27838, partial [Eragrostis curvula]
MASRRFFAYDPSDYYYYPATYHYPNPYYYHQPAPARSSGAGGFFPFAGDADEYYGYQREPSFARSAGRFFPAAEDVDPYYQPAPSRSAGRELFFPAGGNVDTPAARAAVRPKKAGLGWSKPVSIPVRFVGSDPEEPEIARPSPVKKRAPSAEDAAVRLQAAARGFLARRAVRALRAVEREAEEVGKKVAREADALRGDARARIGVGEELMRLLLRLDAVRGAREFLRRVAKRVLALQGAVDALEPRPAPADVAEEAEPESEVTEATADEMAAEGEVAPGLLDAAEHRGEGRRDGGRAAREPCVADEREQSPDGANRVDERPDNADAETKWEMVTEEPEPRRRLPLKRRAENRLGRSGTPTGRPAAWTQRR